MIGYVRIFHVRPEADGGREILPHAFVFPYAFLTFVDERLQTIFFDLIFTVQPQSFFYLQLYRQAMGIPSCFSRHLITFHGAVSGDHIFDNTGQYMADMRLSVGCRRAVVKHIDIVAVPFLHTFFKNVIFFPEFFNFFFSVHKVKIRGNLLVHKKPP